LVVNWGRFLQNLLCGRSDLASRQSPGHGIGSRRNRILGPEEDLAGPLEKSVRQAKRQKSANAGPLSRLR
jgi:hypothetical protein